MTNPFEDPDRRYLVLINDEEQHSLWPASIEVPPGWHLAHPEDTREACLEHVQRHWTDMRPRSLADAMATGGASPDRASDPEGAPDPGNAAQPGEPADPGPVTRPDRSHS